MIIDYKQTEKRTDRETKLKDNLISRLNRIEGQVRGVKGMIDDDRYCDDVLHQIASIQASLNSVSKIILENHIRGCVVIKIQDGEVDVVEELIKSIGQILR